MANRKRKIKKTFYLSEKENAELKRKAKLVGLNESSLVRSLLSGYEPREKPDERFYYELRLLSGISSNLNRLVRKAEVLGFIDEPMLREENKKWQDFRLDVMKKFLSPVEAERKWE